MTRSSTESDCSDMDVAITVSLLTDQPEGFLHEDMYYVAVMGIPMSYRVFVYVIFVVRSRLNSYVAGYNLALMEDEMRAILKGAYRLDYDEKPLGVAIRAVRQMLANNCLMTPRDRLITVLRKAEYDYSQSMSLIE